jgi:hypothetical protein
MEEGDPPEPYLELAEQPHELLLRWLQDTLWEEEVPFRCKGAVETLRRQEAQQKLGEYGVGLTLTETELRSEGGTKDQATEEEHDLAYDEEHLEAIAEKLWGRAREQLQMELPRSAFETWIRDVEAETVEQDQILVLTVGNDFAKDWLEDRLASTTNRVITGIAGKPMQVRFVVQETNQE